MKRGTIEHPKTGELATALKIPRYAAVGLLECAWHFTAKYAPQGNVGKHSNIAIATACHWTTDRADELIDAFVAARWFDCHETHRLVIHDWSDHVEDAVHLQLARAGKLFADGSLPSTKRLSKEERARVEENLERLSSAQHGHESALPSPPKPSPPLPSLPKPEQKHMAGNSPANTNVGKTASATEKRRCSQASKSDGRVTGVPTQQELPKPANMSSEIPAAPRSKTRPPKATVGGLVAQFLRETLNFDNDMVSKAIGMIAKPAGGWSAHTLGAIIYAAEHDPPVRDKIVFAKGCLNGKFGVRADHDDCITRASAFLRGIEGRVKAEEFAA